MAQDFLWNSEEHIVCSQSPPVPGPTLRQIEYRIEYGWVLNPLFHLSLCRFSGTGGLRSPTMCSLLCQRQSRALMKWGADQLCTLSSRCLLTVSEAVWVALLRENSAYGMVIVGFTSSDHLAMFYFRKKYVFFFHLTFQDWNWQNPTPLFFNLQTP